MENEKTIPEEITDMFEELIVGEFDETYNYWEE